MRPFCFLLLSTLALAACGGPPGAADSSACAPTGGPCEFKHDFGSISLAAGTEISGLCESWTLDNPEELLVSSVSLDNDGGYHHSNWFFVPEDSYMHADGQWECGQLHFDEVAAALVGGVLFAQSTQSRADTQRFPQGAVVRLPPYARIIGSTHLLNATGQAITTDLRLSIKTVPPGDARVKLAPMRLAYYDLHIPPGKNSEFRAACDFTKVWADHQKGPFRASLYYVLPHYHVLGNLFRLQINGGPRDGQVLHELHGDFGEPLGKTFDTPVDLSDSQGLTVTCGYHNPRQAEVRWGIGDQEMCEMLGFIDSAVAFEGGVNLGQVTGDRDGTSLNSGPCDVTGFNFTP